MVDEKIVIPLASTATGGLSVLWFAKILFQRLLSKHDAMAKALDSMVTQIKILNLHVSRFEKAEDRLSEATKDLSSLGHQIEMLRADYKYMDQRVKQVEQRP